MKRTKMKNIVDEWWCWWCEWICDERMLTCREVDPPFNDLGRSDGGLGVLGATILPTVHWAGIVSIFGVGRFVGILGKLVGTAVLNSGRPSRFLPDSSDLG